MTSKNPFPSPTKPFSPLETLVPREKMHFPGWKLAFGPKKRVLEPKKRVPAGKKWLFRAGRPQFQGKGAFFGAISLLGSQEGGFFAMGRPFFAWKEGFLA